MLHGMVTLGIMAPVTREHLLAAAEAEPAVRFAVVAAAPPAGQLGARGDAQVLPGFLLLELWGARGAAGGDDEEFHVGDLEGHLGVALAADG